MWSDLALNLAAESVGILLTVAIVDRLIKRAEVRRWDGVYHLLLARLFRGVERVLHMTNVSRGGDATFYHFGDSIVLGYPLQRSLDIFDIEETLAASPSVVEECRNEPHLQEVDRMFAAFEESPSAAREPEILALVAKLRDAITICRDFQTHDAS